MNLTMALCATLVFSKAARLRSKTSFFSFLMDFKIDTKENYSIIRLPQTVLDANMAEELAAACRQLSQNGSLNYIVDLALVPAASSDSLDALSALHEACYGQDQSLAFTQYNEAVLETFRVAGAQDVLNLAPTLQEAIDIISMEGLERMLGDWEEGETEAQESDD